MSALASYEFNGKPVRMAGTNDAPLFHAGDLCEHLGIKNSRDAVKDFPIDEVVLNYSVNSAGKKAPALFLTEKGANRLLFRSDKPQAKALQDWVFGTVLPSIRKTGRFDVEQQAREIAFQHFLLDVPTEHRTTFTEDWFRAILGVWDVEYIKARRPGFVGNVINEFVYDALLKGLPEELKARRKLSGNDYAKLHQFLKTEAKEKLAEPLLTLKVLAKNSQGRPSDFRESFNRVFNGIDQLPLGYVPRKQLISC